MGFVDRGILAYFFGGKLYDQCCIWQAAFFCREITLTVVGFYAQSKPVKLNYLRSLKKSKFFVQRLQTTVVVELHHFSGFLV